jgi:hypothetical protein
VEGVRRRGLVGRYYPRFCLDGLRDKLTRNLVQGSRLPRLELGTFPNVNHARYRYSQIGGSTTLITLHGVTSQEAIIFSNYIRKSLAGLGT